MNVFVTRAQLRATATSCSRMQVGQSGKADAPDGMRQRALLCQSLATMLPTEAWQRPREVPAGISGNRRTKSIRRQGGSRPAGLANGDNEGRGQKRQGIGAT